MLTPTFAKALADSIAKEVKKNMDSKRILSMDFRTMKEAKKLGLHLAHIGTGAFRRTFHVKGTDLVLKMAVNIEGIDHNFIEFNAHKKIMRSNKYAPLKRYMPAIQGMNKLGTNLVMTRYEPVKGDLKECARKEIRMLYLMVQDFGISHPDYGCDVHWRNMGYDDNGGFKFIDLGGFVL